MSDTHPGETELLSFVDADLSPEQLDKVEKHLERCSACAKRVMTLSELGADIAAEVPQAGWDVAAHVDGVMKRLDEPVEVERRSRLALWGGLAAIAASAALFVTARGHDLGAPHGTLTARGASAAASLSRDVGVQLYAQEASLRPLGSGSRIRPDTRLTAGLRNLASQRAHLLLFAVDARHVVHWIAPRFTVPGSNPAAAIIATSNVEQLLPSAVVFDDLAPGPLRVVSVITAEPTLVSEIESLNERELSDDALVTRFPRAEVRQILVQVTNEHRP